MLVVVTGVPGVGKTTVMDEAARCCGFPVINFGSEMLKVAQEHGLAFDRDDIRKLSVAAQRDLQVEAAKEISKMGDVFVDTHASILTPAGYMSGLPTWVLDVLDPKLIVLVQANPADIHRRRVGDDSRARDEHGIEIIDEHQRLNRMVAMSCAQQLGTTVKIIMNQEGKVEEAVQELESAVNHCKLV
jgi:adenylate kinase